MTSATIIVPVDIWKFSQNALTDKMHWRAKAGIIKSARKAGYVAWLAAGRPQIEPDACVHVTIRRGRRFDMGNVDGALKRLIDGIFDDGLDIDDGLVSTGSVAFETGKHWVGKEEVELRFEWVNRARPLNDDELPLLKGDNDATH